MSIKDIEAAISDKQSRINALREREAVLQEQATASLSTVPVSKYAKAAEGRALAQHTLTAFKPEIDALEADITRLRNELAEEEQQQILDEATALLAAATAELPAIAAELEAARLAYEEVLTRAKALSLRCNRLHSEKHVAANGNFSDGLAFTLWCASNPSPVGVPGMLSTYALIEGTDNHMHPWLFEMRRV